MSYRWSQEGPAFEFGNPFGTENRFLLARCVLLCGVAVVMLWLVLATGDGGQGSASLLRVGPERGSSTPHVLAATAALLLALAELLRWLKGRKRVLLQPGQPASLAAEVRRESVGAGADAPRLLLALEQGGAAPLPTVGPYRQLLLALSTGIAAAPQTLHAELQIRIGNLLLGAGLTLALLANWWLLSPPAARELAAVFDMVLGGAFVARGVLHPERPAPRPLAVAGVLALALLGHGVAYWLAAVVPQTRHLLGLGLPPAALVLLASGLLFDALGLVAGLAQAAAVPALPGGDGRAPAQASAAASETRVPLQAEPALLMQEIDRELLRRWTDGIPNRRHIWQPPVIDASLPAGSFTATVLEESQPLLATLGADGGADGGVDAGANAGAGARATPMSVSRGTAWLVLLNALGVLWTAAGGVLWVQAAHAQSQSVDVPWPAAAAGTMLVLAGGYALRVGHLLWTRTEAASTLIWLAFKGSFVAGGASPAAPGAARDGPAASIDMLTLRAWVVQVRSVFYAAAPHTMGSRVLLRMAGDADGAAAWTQHLQSLARSLQPAAAALRPAEVAARKADPGPLTPPKPPPRFCSACGTPLLQGARFCQQCGNVL